MTAPNNDETDADAGPPWYEAEAIQRGRSSWEMLENESDRGLILVGAALVDEAVADAIKAASANKKAAAKMLKGGAARNAGARIDIAESFGLLSSRMAKACRALCAIRNRASHYQREKGFDVLFDADRTLELLMEIEQNLTFKIKLKESVGSPRDRFLGCCMYLLIATFLTANKYEAAEGKGSRIKPGIDIFAAGAIIRAITGGPLEDHLSGIDDAIRAYEKEYGDDAH